MISILRNRFVKHSRRLNQYLRVKAGVKPDLTQYYFGYGANLSFERFTSKKMFAAELGNAVLKNHEMRFSLSNEYKDKGYAGVHPKEGSEVYGAAFKIDEHSLRLMDAMEWCGFGAYRRELLEIELLEMGEQVKAWCYIVDNPKEGLFPSKVYLSNIIKTSKERGFPTSYIDFLNSHEAKETFEIDYGFSLLFYGKRRPWAETLLPIYKCHDKLREKLSDLI